MTATPGQAAGTGGRLRSRSRKGALREAVALSELHLSLASQELWERWEKVAERKSEIYKIIEVCNKTPMDPDERDLAAAVLDLERRMLSVLVAKRRQTEEDLNNALAPRPAAKAVSGHGRLLRVAC